MNYEEYRQYVFKKKKAETEAMRRELEFKERQTYLKQLTAVKDATERENKRLAALEQARKAKKKGEA
jgi:hypothetical protein